MSLAPRRGHILNETNRFRKPVCIVSTRACRLLIPTEVLRPLVTTLPTVYLGPERLSLASTSVSLRIRATDLPSFLGNPPHTRNQRTGPSMAFRLRIRLPAIPSPQVSPGTDTNIHYFLFTCKKISVLCSQRIEHQPNSGET